MNKTCNIFCHNLHNIGIPCEWKACKEQNPFCDATTAESTFEQQKE
jgi:hypothetical protein